MRRRKLTGLLAAGALLISTFEAHAQQQKHKRDPEGSHLDIAVVYQGMYSNPVGSGDNFWLQGGSIQIHGQFWRGLGEVAEVSGVHNGQVSSGVGLDMVTVTFGPRYDWLIHHKGMTAYGQALVGKAFGFNSVFPGTNGAADTSDSLAFVLGGGVGLPLKRGFALRALEADWVRTQMPNAASNVQNDLRLGAGVVFHVH